MSLVTRGLGPGSGLIVRGMGFLSSFIQNSWSYWKRIFWHQGERYAAFKFDIFGDTVHDLKIKRNIYGDYSTTIIVTNNLYGDLVGQKEKLIESKIFGDTSHNINENIKLTGKKDFRRLIWELLLDDD